MQSKRWIAGLLLYIGLAVSAAVGQNVEADKSKEIEQLINQLASPDDATRKAAQEKLVTMGDEARKALEAFVKARAAAEAALAQLDTNRVAGPTIVTFNVSDGRPEKAFAELSKIIGVEIMPYNTGMWSQGNLRKVSGSYENKPFWEVMRDLCIQADVSLYQGGGSNERRIQLMPASNMGGKNPMKYPSAVQGAFLVMVNHLQRTNTVDMANPQQVMRSVNMQLSVYAEPKVKVQQYSYQPVLEEAVDDKGNSLVPEGTRRGGFRENMSTGRGSNWNMSMPLAYPKDPGTKIAKLRGQLKFIVQTRSETIEVTNLESAKDVTKTIAGRQFVLKDFKKQGTSNYNVRIVMYRGSLDQQAFYDQINNPSLRLLDVAGREFGFNGVNNSSNSGDMYEMQVGFYRQGGPGTVGEPEKLIWEVPTSVQEVSVPFEFTNLPLP